MIVCRFIHPPATLYMYRAHKLLSSHSNSFSIHHRYCALIGVDVVQHHTHIRYIGNLFPRMTKLQSIRNWGWPMLILFINKRGIREGGSWVYKEGRPLQIAGTLPHASILHTAICLSNEFTCSNGNCIPAGYQCDRYNHCGDSSDEVQCGKV